MTQKVSDRHFLLDESGANDSPWSGEAALAKLVLSFFCTKTGRMTAS